MIADISQGKLPPGPAAAEFTPDQLCKSTVTGFN